MTIKAYGRFEVKQPRLLPHSKLYSLTPIGIGTPYVEGLTSYAVRLATAHCLEFGKFVAGVIAPVLGKSYILSQKNPSLSVRFCSTAQSINNMGVMSAEWVRVLEELTLQQNLTFLTMSPWREVFPETGVTRKVRAWCPSCFEERRDAGLDAYEPLLWSLSCITVCTRHEEFLHEVCHSCLKSMYPFSARGKTAHCWRCDQWLGSARSETFPKKRPDDETLAYQKWVGEQLGCLIAAAPKLPQAPENGMIVKAVKACIEKVSGGCTRSFIQQMGGISRTNLDGWLYGHSRPRLGTLMALCHYADVPIKDFFLNAASTLRPSHVKIRDTSEDYNRKFEESELIKMEAMMQPMSVKNPPPSVKKVAARIGCHQLTLRKYFPNMYSAIAKRYTEYIKNLYDKERLQRLLKDIQMEEPPPPLNEVARRTGCSRGFLRLTFPEDCRIIVERYASQWKDRYDRKMIKKKMEGLLRSTPPISLKSCAEQLSLSMTHLYRSFSTLCRRISARYAAYRSRTLAERRSSNESAIRRGIYKIISEGSKPTVTKIKKRLPGAPMYKMNVEALIREICP
jgi:transcriptional regulator with XRE-family HTH domain